MGKIHYTNPLNICIYLFIHLLTEVMSPCLPGWKGQLSLCFSVLFTIWFNCHQFVHLHLPLVPLCVGLFVLSAFLFIEWTDGIEDFVDERSPYPASSFTVCDLYHSLQQLSCIQKCFVNTFDDVMVLQLFFTWMPWWNDWKQIWTGKTSIVFRRWFGWSPFCYMVEDDWFILQGISHADLTWLDLPAFFLRETGYPASCSSFFLLIWANYTNSRSPKQCPAICV